MSTTEFSVAPGAAEQATSGLKNRFGDRLLTSAAVREQHARGDFLRQP